MPPDDDPSLDPGQMTHGLFALIAIVAMGGVGYARDLHAAIKQVFGRGGLETALREEHSRAKAEVLALAVIADGAITDAERTAIAELAAREGIDGAEALAAVTALTEAVRDPAVLRKKVAERASPLDADERLELFVAVKNLAHRGSGAWPEEAGYRGASGPTPDALVAAFRDALGIRAAKVSSTED